MRRARRARAGAPRAGDGSPCGSPSSGSAPTTGRQPSRGRPTLKPAPSKTSTWSSPDPGRLAQLRPRAGLLVLDPAGVADLAASGRVERGPLQLRLEPAVAQLVEGEDRRQHLGLLVADEFGPAVPGEPSRPGSRRRARPRGARPSARWNSSSSTGIPRSSAARGSARTESRRLRSGRKPPCRRWRRAQRRPRRASSRARASR